jgi:uncharacterized protein (TIGR00369 family)
MAITDPIAPTTGRTRTHAWDEPTSPAEVDGSLSGLEFLEAIARGDLPGAPIASTLGFEIDEVASGTATFAVVPAEYHYNPIGTVHGGLAATLLDSALGCAVQTVLPPGAGYTTLELKVNFVRPLTTETGRLTCRADVIHVGRRVGTAEARLEDETGRLFAHGTTTCMIFSPPTEEASPP